MNLDSFPFMYEILFTRNSWLTGLQGFEAGTLSRQIIWQNLGRDKKLKEDDQ
jgi:hypothetical protein